MGRYMFSRHGPKPVALFVILTLLAATIAVASEQANPLENTVAPASGGEQQEIQKFTTDEVYTIIAPIAIYPDKVLAQLFPATAFPEQLVAAQKFVAAGGNADNPPADAEWDGSVVAIMRFPNILKTLAEDPDWCEQINLCATYQMSDVIAAIQQVRAEAKAAGNLVSNDKILVTTQANPQNQNAATVSNVINIEPADPKVIYIPVYNPETIVVPATPPCPVCEVPIVIEYPPPCWTCDYGCFTNVIDWWGVWGFRIRVHDFWDFRFHRWHHHDHPIFFSAPFHHVPPYYLKHGGLKGPPVLMKDLKGMSGNKLVKPPLGPKSKIKPDSLKIDGSKPTIKKDLPTIKRDHIGPKTPDTLVPSHKPPIGPTKNKIGPFSDTEGLGKQGNATVKEAERGKISRTPTTPLVPKTPVIPHTPFVPATPIVPKSPYVPKTPVPTLPKGPSGGHLQGMHPTDRGTVNRESSRGAASRRK